MKNRGLVLVGLLVVFSSINWAAQDSEQVQVEILVDPGVTAVASRSIRLGIKLELKQNAGAKGAVAVDGVLTIRNHSGDTAVVQSPTNRLAAAFIVLDSRGNVVVPTGKAKVDPPFRELTLKPNEEFKQVFEGLKFITGTGQFGYDLKSGERYRVTAIYRPVGPDGDGLCSNEVSITLR